MQQTIKLGQVRPSILSTVERTVKNCNTWLDAQSRTFSSLCGEKVTHKDVILSHLWYAAAIIIIGIGGVL
jgi:hypothetical protein